MSLAMKLPSFLLCCDRVPRPLSTSSDQSSVSDNTIILPGLASMQAYLHDASMLLIIFSWIICAVAHYMNPHVLFRCQSVYQAESSISCTIISRPKIDVATPIQTSTKEAQAYIADCIIKTVPRTQFGIRIFHQDLTTCEIMPCFSIKSVRSLLSTFILRVLSPANPRETVLFGGPDPERSSTLVSVKSDIPMMSKEGSILTAPSGSGVPAKSPVRHRLHVSAPLFHVHTTL